MNIIGYSIDKELGIYCSDGTYCHKPSYLEFLVKPVPDSIRVFSDLDSDVAALLALIQLKPRELEKLYYEKMVYLQTASEPYILKYIPGKWFSIDKGINKGHQWSGFSDMSQYDELPPLKAIEAKAINAKVLGEMVYQAMCELGLHPKTLISPANVYRKEHTLNMPAYEDVPEEAMHIAYDCCKGNWVEAYKLGHFEHVYDYDINSAYPYQASLLMDLRNGEWIHSNEYQSNATYGYCHCEVMIESNFSPIILPIGEENYTPKGVFETALTKREIDFINCKKLGYVTILDGWWWKVSGIKHPFRQEIEDLYQLKQQSTGIKREIIKRIMAGSYYGMFIETRDNQFGDCFMAPYAAEIEANTRIQIAATCMTHNIKPLHIAVDGFISDQPITIPVVGDMMGLWRLAYEGKCIVASSGLVAMEGKQGTGDFSISYDWLYNMISKQPNSDSYTKERQQVLSLAQYFLRNELDNLGSIEHIQRTVEFGDNKRLYTDMPITWKELLDKQYDSEAWSANEIKLMHSMKEDTV